MIIISDFRGESDISAETATPLLMGIHILTNTSDSASVFSFFVLDTLIQKIFIFR